MSKQNLIKHRRTASGDGYKTDNHIISECSKLAEKEYKGNYDWVGKVIHNKLCKGLKFSHAEKWYMLKLESLLKKRNEQNSLGF